MISKLFLLVALVAFALVLQSSGDCQEKNKGTYHYDCGPDCTGRPPCGDKRCGNVDDMCYCDCTVYQGQCLTTAKGYTWNGGIKLANGSYALNGTKGDGKEYKC